jgi:hypothetical protein
MDNGSSRANRVGLRGFCARNAEPRTERSRRHRDVHVGRSKVRHRLGACISTGSFLWAVLTAVGLTALIASYASILTAIKIAGGLYLLWLAFKAFRSATATKPDLRPVGVPKVLQYVSSCAGSPFR